LSYIGQRPVVGRYIKLDQISSGFNGSETSFSMTAGSQAVFPGTARNLLLSLGGVIQEPDTNFTISGSTLTFTTAPVANTTFFAVIFGDMQSTGTPSDGTVLPASIASSGNFSFPQLTVTGTSSLGDDVTFTGASANVTFDKSSNEFLFADNAKASFGNNGDMVIKHTGSNSIIEDIGQGNLEVQTNSSIFLQKGNTEFLAKFISDGACELYYDNSKKLETVTGGVTITGTCTATAFAGDGSSLTGITSVGGSTGVDFNDNVKARFGTGNDLEIFHNGNHSRILDNGTGKLQLGSDTEVEILNGSFNESMTKFQPNGAVELYYDNTKRFETTANGVEVSAGRLDVGSVQLSGGGLALSDNDKVVCGSGDDLEIYHDGSHSRIVDSGTGVLSLQSDTLRIHNVSANEYMAEFVENGAASLYYDNSKKFETTSTGAQVSSSAGTLRIQSTTNQSSASLEMTSSSGASQIGKIAYNHANSGIVSGYNEAFLIDGTETNLAVKVDGAIKIPDSTTKDAKLLIGEGHDLQIYHDGSHSRIVDAGTGVLAIQGPDIRIHNEPANELMADFVANGAASLYYDNSKKLETVATGINVTGRIGIGDTTPQYEIEIKAAGPIIRLEETSTGGSKRLDLGVTSGGQPFIGANQSSQSIQIETSGSRRFTFGTSEMFTAENGTDFSWGSNPGHIIYQNGEYRSTSANGTHIRCNRMNGDGHVAQWYRGQTNLVGFISITSSGTSYGSGSSDERTKKNIEDWSESVLSKFKSLTPKLFNFNWEDDSAAKHKGYIAQNEVDKFPEAYPKNNLTDCDNEFYTFTPTDMTIYLMKGLKEAAEKIAELETKVAALEAA